MLRVLRVPFKDRGRDWAGWDCWGCVKVLAPLVYGFAVPDFGDRYEATDWTNARALDALIAREMAGFEEGPPGEAYPILTFERFGVRAHVGLAISSKEMIHADGSANGGGTYRVRYDIDQWARTQRKMRAFRPAGWVLA